MQRGELPGQVDHGRAGGADGEIRRPESRRELLVDAVVPRPRNSGQPDAQGLSSARAERDPSAAGEAAIEADPSAPDHLYANAAGFGWPERCREPERRAGDEAADQGG